VRRLLQNLFLWISHILITRPVLFWLVGLRIRRRNLVPEGSVEREARG